MWKMWLFDCSEKKKEKYIYYSCSNKKGTCERKFVREEALHKMAEEQLAQIQIEEPLMELVRVGLKESSTEIHSLHKSEISRIQKEQQNIPKMLGKLFISRIDSDIAEGFFKEMKKKWGLEQDRFEIQII